MGGAGDDNPANEREGTEIAPLQANLIRLFSGSLIGVQVEFFSLVSTPRGDRVKLLSENMLQGSTAAPATVLQQNTSADDPGSAKVKVCCLGILEC